MTETTPQVLSEDEIQRYLALTAYKKPYYVQWDIEALAASHRILTTERDQQAWDVRSLEATVENLRGEVGRLRVALEDARHSLVALNGLWATDRSISDRREDASECGIDNHALLDVMDEVTWRVDEEPVLARIDAALAGEEG